MIDSLTNHNVLTVEMQGHDLWKNKKQKGYWVI